MNVNISQLNYFKRVLAVQEEYNLHKREGLSNVYIFKNFIQEKFHIAESTYKKYLGINAKRQIRLIEEKKAQLQNNQNATSNV